MDPTLYDCRLKKWEEIIEMEKQDPTFPDYVNFVYEKLNSMAPGESYLVSKRIRPENREKFVKIACMYMSECKEEYYVFGKDCFTIKRLEETVEQTIERLKKIRDERKRRSQEMDREATRDSTNDSGWHESGGPR